MKLHDLKACFCLHFDQGYIKVPPAPLVVSKYYKGEDDLMFTNSGMVQFIDVFKGEKKPPSKKWMTIQPCLRLSGKHNDFSTAGYSLNHRLLFTMLGFFEAHEADLESPLERVSNMLLLALARVFNLFGFIGIHLWNLHITLPKEIQKYRDSLLGDFRKDVKQVSYLEDATWSAGEKTDLFGYSGEVYYVDPKTGVELELWNVVCVCKNGKGEWLPSFYIDTGGGAERILSVVNGEDLTKAGTKNDRELYLREAIDALIEEGVIPSANNEGYVLRRLIKEYLELGGSCKESDTLFAAEKQRLDKIKEKTDKILATRDKFNGTEEEWKFYLKDTHGIELTN